jgi:transcriptional regulator with XRE-family HTH domain
LLPGRNATRWEWVRAAEDSGTVHSGLEKRRAQGGAVLEVEVLREGPEAVRSPRSMSAIDFRKRREELGYTQEGIAKEFGQSRAWVSLIELGLRQASSSIAEAMDTMPPAPDSRKRRRARKDAERRVEGTLKKGAPRGVSKTVLRRKENAGYSSLVLEVLDDWERKGFVHRRDVPGPQGRREYRFFLGPATDRPSQISPKKLEQLRSDRRLSREALGTEIGVSPGAVAAHESGHRSLPSYALREVAPALARIDAALREQQAGDRERVRAELRTGEGIAMSGRGGLVGKLGRPGTKQAVDWLVANDEAHAARTGGKGRRLRYYLGPRPAEVTAKELALMGQGAGVTRREMAQCLGWSESKLSAIMRGRRPVPHEPGLRGFVDVVLPTMVHERRAKIIRFVKAHPPVVTREELTRGQFGRSATVEADIEALEAVEDLFRTSGVRLGASGVEKAVTGFSVVRPAKVAPMTASQLDKAIRHRGIGANGLGRQMGVSGTAVRNWLRLGPPEGRVPEIQIALAALPELKHVPRPPIRLSDEELLEAAVAAVKRAPHRPKRQIARELPGDVRRRWWALNEIVARGWVKASRDRIPDALGRLHEHEVLDPVGC